MQRKKEDGGIEIDEGQSARTKRRGRMKMPKTWKLGSRNDFEKVGVPAASLTFQFFSKILRSIQRNCFQIVSSERGKS